MATDLPSALDIYEDYQPVESFQNLTGPGDRIFTIPNALDAERSAPLRVVKIERAVVMLGKNIINLRTRKLILDAMRNPLRATAHLAKRKPEEYSEETIARVERGSRTIHLSGLNYAALSRHNGYGHYLLEGMSQLWAAQHIDVTNARVIINHVAKSFPEDMARPFFGDRVHRLTVSPVLATNLIVASQAYVLPDRVSSPFWAVADRIAGRDCEAVPTRIYVSRARAYKRRLIQESEIEEIFAAHGFTIIYPELLSFDEQVGLFKRAEWVAGTVGSGTYNAAFSPPHMRKIILAPHEFHTPNDETLTRDHPMTYLFGESLNDDPRGAMFSNWSIDVEMVRAKVDEAMCAFKPVVISHPA